MKKLLFTLVLSIVVYVAYAQNSVQNADYCKQFNSKTDIMVVYNITSTTVPTRIFSNREGEFDLTKQMLAMYIDGQQYNTNLVAGQEFCYKFSTTGVHVVIIRLASTCNKIGYWTGWLASDGGYATQIHIPSQISYIHEGTGLEDWYVSDLYCYRNEAPSGQGWVWNSTGTRNSIGMNLNSEKVIHVVPGATGYTSNIWAPLTNELGYKLAFDATEKVGELTAAEKEAIRVAELEKKKKEEAARVAEAQRIRKEKEAEAKQQQLVKNFYAKWGKRFNDLTRGIVSYGCPKQFFIDLAKALPDRFEWEQEGTYQGYVIYAFQFKRNDNPYSNAILVGRLAFKGNTLVESDVNAYG